MSGLIYAETREVLKQFIEQVLKLTIEYTSYGQRKTVRALDVILAAKHLGITMYGFEGTKVHGKKSNRHQHRAVAAEQDSNDAPLQGLFSFPQDEETEPDDAYDSAVSHEW